MSRQIPTSMQAIALAKFGAPKVYDLATLPVPTITKPDELLIKVHAASVNPIDVKMANGIPKLMGEKVAFPFKVGYDLAGVVAAVGSSVTHFKPGDEVYSRVPSRCRGSIAQYSLAIESSTALKPASLSFATAASIPLAGQTAYQAFLKADKQLPGGLAGKTVFVPAGLSGTGSFAVQLAKNVFRAGNVITTLSTGKIPVAEELLGKGVVDQIVDYTKEKDVVGKIGKGSVDFMFDTAGQTMPLLGIMKKGGLVLSISTLPSGRVMQAGQDEKMPFYIYHLLNFVDWFIKRWLRYHSVDYEYLKLEGRKEDLEDMTRFVEEGKVKPIVGEKAVLSDIEAVRRGCEKIHVGKGGTGKFVIEID